MYCNKSVSYTHLVYPPASKALQIHAEIRPDIFIPGTTKYTVCELAELLKQEDKPIYVAVNEDCLLYTSRCV